MCKYLPHSKLNTAYSVLQMAREPQQKPRCLSCLYICCDNSVRTAAGIPSAQQLITIGRGRMLYTFIYSCRKISSMLKCIASCSPVKENGAQREADVPADVPADFRMKQRCNHTVLRLNCGGNILNHRDLLQTEGFFHVQNFQPCNQIQL